MPSNISDCAANCYGRFDGKFSIIDELNPQNKQKLISLTAALRCPDDYFRGVLRRSEPGPDNLLLFVRLKSNQLWSGTEAPSFHQRWVLLVALSGTGTLLVEQKPLQLAANHAILVPPLRLHGYRDVSPGLHWLFVTFDWPGHTCEGEVWPGPRSLHPSAQRRLLEVICATEGRHRSGTIASAALLELLRELWPQGARSGEVVETLLGRVQAAVRNLPGATLPELAQQIGISESHLRARFRNELGISLGRYLREVRLRQAALWIRDEGLSVTAAADRAGYTDLPTFSRAFHKTLGVPPSVMKLKSDSSDILP